VNLPPFLAFRLPGRWGVLQGKADFKIIVFNHQSDGSLPGLASHPAEKIPQRGHLLFNQMLAFVSLNDDRLVKQELAALGVVTPDATALRKGGGPAEHGAQHVQCLFDPEPLIDGLVAAILARDEQDQQGRCGFAGTECSGEIWHEDLYFFTCQYPTFCPESQP
jgi:hypothetical protein